VSSCCRGPEGGQSAGHSPRAGEVAARGLQPDLAERADVRAGVVDGGEAVGVRRAGRRLRGRDPEDAQPKDAQVGARGARARRLCCRGAWARVTLDGL
jgi:hypothetical protein